MPQIANRPPLGSLSSYLVPVVDNAAAIFFLADPPLAMVRGETRKTGSQKLMGMGVKLPARPPLLLTIAGEFRQSMEHNFSNTAKEIL